MVEASVMPGGVSRQSEIPFDLVDDDEMNAYERVFEAISKRAKTHPGSPTSLSTASSPMRVSALSAPLPVSSVHGRFTQRTSFSTLQQGWHGQNANSADFKVARESPERGEFGIVGQSGIRASNFSDLWGSSSGCPARTQASDGFQTLNGDLQQIQTGPDTGVSAVVSEAGLDSPTVLESREGGSPGSEKPPVYQVEVDGGKGEPAEGLTESPDEGPPEGLAESPDEGPSEGLAESPDEGPSEVLAESPDEGPLEGPAGPAEGRKVRQLPPWMQATSLDPQKVVNAAVSAGRSIMPVDNEKRSAEAVDPGSFSTEQDQQLQSLPWRMPWNIQQSSFVDNVKPQYPMMQFRGQIVYSKTESEVHTASLELLQRIREIQEARAGAGSGAIPVGFDVEWRANFERGELPNRVAVLQLCLDARRCDVMQIVHSGIPPSLQNILEDPSTIKVGVGIHADVYKLLTDWGTMTRNVEDLRKTAQKTLKLSRDWSLASMTFHFTGKQIDKNKSIRCGDWEALPLSAPQLLYAATDAFAGVHLYQILSTFSSPETKGQVPANAKDREALSNFPSPETKEEGPANATGQEIISKSSDPETKGQGSANASGQSPG